MSTRLALLHGFDLQGDPHLVPYQNSARLQRLVPAQSEVPTVDSRLSAEPRPLVTPGVLLHTLQTHVEGHLFGYVADGKVPNHAGTVAVTTFHPGALEGDVGK